MAGRKPLDIDLTLLQEIITKIEDGDAPPKARTALWAAVAAAFPIKVSPQTLMTKAEKNSLSIKTPKGKRGYSLLDARATPKSKKVRKYKKGYEEEVSERFDRLGTKTVGKMLAGNLKSAVKAFCWDCMGESKKEVALCSSYSCPLWPHRPWQREKKEVFSLPLVENNTTLSDRSQSGESEPSSGVADKTD